MKSKRKITFLFISLAGILYFLTFCKSNIKRASEVETTHFVYEPIKKNFDTTLNGKAVALYQLTNKNNLEVTITNYGARIVNLIVPDKEGSFDDIVTGFNSIKEYLNANQQFFGCVVGRYANRIAKGRFTLDGKEYQLAVNNGINHLHGGPGGFHQVVWDVKKHDGHSIRMKYLSPDMEEGYPGNLNVEVQYTLTDSNELKIEYFAETDKPTILNLTNHAFFNLDGEDAGSINDHVLMINADHYTPVDSNLIPTGEIVEVGGTPFDFREPKSIKQDIEADHIQLKYGNGFDHNFVLNKEFENELTLAARVKETNSERVMEVFTTEPGIQFYGGNFLRGKDTGKSGVNYDFRTSFCLETQHFPDSPNNEHFPSVVLRPGEKFRSETVYLFKVQ